jgi:hypothetical protein
MNRLEKLPTLRINPAQTIAFRYKNKSFEGLSGDTVASALYANGIRIFSRSLKYHRPRGLYSLDGESSNTCMQVNGIPNVCAENTLLKDGMRLKAQNVKGTPERDLMGFMDKLDWAMPAGFYYRTLHKPARIWPMALKQVRKAAGLGKISPDFQMPGKLCASSALARRACRRPWQPPHTACGSFCWNPGPGWVALLTTARRITAMASRFLKAPGKWRINSRKPQMFVFLPAVLWWVPIITTSSPRFRKGLKPIHLMNVISKSGPKAWWWPLAVSNARCFLKTTSGPVSCRSLARIG